MNSKSLWLGFLMLSSTALAAQADNFGVPPSGVLAAPPASNVLRTPIPATPKVAARKPKPGTHLSHRRPAPVVRAGALPVQPAEVEQPMQNQVPAQMAALPEPLPAPQPVAPAPNPSFTSKLRGLFASRSSLNAESAPSPGSAMPNYLLPARRTSYEERGLFTASR